jgi:hypothetical protein
MARVGPQRHRKKKSYLIITVRDDVHTFLPSYEVQVFVSFFYQSLDTRSTELITVSGEYWTVVHLTITGQHKTAWYPRSLLHKGQSFYFSSVHYFYLRGAPVYNKDHQTDTCGVFSLVTTVRP